MKLKKENFKLLLQLADTSPQLSSIMIKYRIVKVPIGDAKVTGIQPVHTDTIILDEKINAFLAGQIPNLTFKECKKIRSFLNFQRQLEVRNLSIKVMQDITYNAENTNQSQLKRHLQNMVDEIEPILFAIKEIARIAELEANDTYAMPFDIIKEFPFHKDRNLNKQERETIRLLTELLFGDNFFLYYIFRDVKNHIDNIRHNEWFIDLDKEYKMENSKPVKQKEPINTLADAAINDEAERKIFEVLITAGLIDKESKIVTDKAGGNKGHFYSTIILFFDKGYFSKKPTAQEYLNICKNTFKIDISTSTANNHTTRPKCSFVIPVFIPTD